MQTNIDPIAIYKVHLVHDRQHQKSNFLLCILESKYLHIEQHIDFLYELGFAYINLNATKPNANVSPNFTIYHTRMVAANDSSFSQQHTIGTFTNGLIVSTITYQLSQNPWCLSALSQVGNGWMMCQYVVHPLTVAWTMVEIILLNSG